jgi:hypothetical protein
MLLGVADDFELVGEITDIEVIAVNLSIRERKRLKAMFGGRRSCKLKGVGQVRFPNGEVHKAELHWYQAHGVRAAKDEGQAEAGLKYANKDGRNRFCGLRGRRVRRRLGSREGLSRPAGCAGCRGRLPAGH